MGGAATGKRNGILGGDNDEDPIARNIFPLSLPTSLPLPCYRHQLLSLAVMMRRRKEEDEDESICAVQRGNVVMLI